jgi:hypothetical protein
MPVVENLGADKGGVERGRRGNEASHEKRWLLDPKVPNVDE